MRAANGTRCVFTIALAAAIAAAGSGRGQAEKGAAAEPPKPAEKSIAFSMSGKPWKDVFQWLTDQTGQPVITPSFVPDGTFTFFGPARKTYTVPEVIDILNEALLSKKDQRTLLIRRANSFVLVPADEKIPPEMLPRIAADDLDKHGNTEMVSVVLQMNSLVAEDIAPEVKKMLGPFGEVSALSQANQLVVQDTVGNIKRIRATLGGAETSEKGTETFTHECKYIKARDAERILKELLGDPKALLALQAQQHGPQQWQQGQGGQPGQQQGRPQQAAAPAVKVRMHYISSDDRSNKVLVTGPPDKIGQAREILLRIDVPQSGQPPVLVGPPVLKTYTAPSGNAEALAKTLQEIYKSSPNIRISAAGNNTVLVYAGPDDQIEIAKQIIGGTDRGVKTELIDAGSLDAAKVAETLKGMLGDPKSGGPFVEAQDDNAIAVRGTPDQLEEVRAAVRTLGGGGSSPGNLSTGNLRVITLEKGGAATLAEALQRMLPQLRQNPVEVVTPMSGAQPAQPGPKAPEPKKNEPAPAPGGGGPGLFDPQDKKPEPGRNDRPGRANAPIRISAFGNKIMISSDDPEALKLAQELVRLLTRTPSGEGDFEVIHLKNASAAEAAKVLDEAFNGPRQQQPGAGGPGGFPFGPGRFFNQFAGAGARLPEPKKDAIRVVADPNSNSLLVRASPLDILTIRRLLEKAIDSGDVDSNAVQRTYVLGPLKYASANDVAAVLKDVYREQTNNNPTPTQVGGFPGFGFRAFAAATRNVDANGNPRQVSLSIGVDDRTNSLILQCNNAMYEDVKKLVANLEERSKDVTRTVDVIRIDGADPLLVQQAIDAIQGRTTIPSSRPASTATGGAVSPIRGGVNQPGGTGGGMFRPGGGMYPGGGIPGGGRPGGGGGGGGRSTGPQGRADFFAQRVTDDPQPILIDPQADDTSAGASEEQEQQQPPAPAAPQPPPAASGPEVNAPRGQVTAEALPELGVIVVQGANAADVAAVRRIIETIVQFSRNAEARVELVPLQNADATNLANLLTQLYQRVTVSATGNASTITGPRTTSTQIGVIGQFNQTTSAPASVAVLPVPRLNALLVGAPKSRFEDILAQIKRLDVPNAKSSYAVPFPLKRASAARVEQVITTFYSQRYPGEAAQAHQVRLTHDDSTNTVFVQAAPADLAEIRDLIERIDQSETSAVNDVRVVPLNNALADELSALILRTISQGIVPPTVSQGVGTTGGGLGGGGGGLLGGAGLFGGGLFGGAGAGGAAAARPGGALGGANVATALGTAGTATATGGGTSAATRTAALRFIGARREPGKPYESGFLEDIFLTPDLRTNSIIVSAPPKSMDLVLAMIRELDLPPAAVAEVNIFPLRRADAYSVATMLQQLFLGTGGVGSQRPGPVAPVGGTIGIAGAVGAGGGLGGGALGGGALGGAGALGGGALGGAAGLPTAAGAVAGAVRPLQLTLSGVSPEGAPLIDLRLTVDQPTNSLIAAGSRNDLAVIEAIITRLDEVEVQTRRNEVYHLHNSNAVDVANALSTFLLGTLRVLQAGQELTAYQEIQRDVVVVPEPITNKLLISATPRYFPDVMRLIEELDAEEPQVVVQVLIAEVDLSGDEEFGVELGLQSPILFNRSIFPQQFLFGPNGSSTATNATGGLVPPGVTVNNSINPVAQPGFNFNNPALPLGNNPSVGPGTVGFQGLTSLGTGRVSPNNSGVSGFVFSASSDAFNLLIRALKTQGRIDILNRTHLTTLDNQQARVFVGQNFPIITGSNVTATGIVSNNIVYTPVGVELIVTPRITPDGRVIMRVTPQVSSTAPTSVALGNGVTAVAINQQLVDTTVVTQDGETVALGGLISRNDTKTENKVPWLGDLPGVGVLFRYRQQTKSKQELMVIMTPHVVRTPLDRARYLVEEGLKMDWSVPEVLNSHGVTNMGPLLDALTPPGAKGGPAGAPGGPGGPGGPGPLAPPFGPCLEPPPASEPPAQPAPAAPTLPLPRKLPDDAKAPAPGPATPAGAKADPAPAQPRGMARISTAEFFAPGNGKPNAPAATDPAGKPPAQEDQKESTSWWRASGKGS